MVKSTLNSPNYLAGNTIAPRFAIKIQYVMKNKFFLDYPKIP